VSVRARTVACLLALLGFTRAPNAHADALHTVRSGETLASIAQRYYGDVAREATLVAANVLNAQANASLLPGMRIVVPSISYARVEPGDTWQRVAQRELGLQSRAAYLARVNSADLRVPPSPGAVLRIPYLLRYVVMDDEPLFEIARRFYGDRTQVQFILEFNRMSSSRLQRGQVLLVPLADLTLREEPVCESSAPLAGTSQAQRRIEQEIPALEALIAHGQYIEAIALGARLGSAGELSTAQRVAIQRVLAEAYCAVDRLDLAAEAFREALSVDRSLTLDPHTTPPKVLDAFNMARGLGSARTIAPAPPTARPDEAH
jgi:LysM repeat protein